MARLSVPDENLTLDNPEDIRSFLKPYGIWYEKWPVEGRLAANASNDEILTTYAPEIERLRSEGGYVTADVINVTPETPGLDAMLAKFDKEHTHSEDEVRFTVKGSGVFHIHPDSGPVFAIQVESGDLINVPAGTKHWFNLCNDRTIRCIRLFLDAGGWAPHYVDHSAHVNYDPVCWGPNYLPARDADFSSPIKL